MSQRTLLNKADSNPDPVSRFDIGLGDINEPVELAESSKIEMRTRQPSVTTAEVPVFYKAASLKDEGGLPGNDGVRESWHLETGQGGGRLDSGRDREEVEQVEHFGVSRLREPERTWGESSKDRAEGSQMWITVNDRVVRGR